MQIPNTVDLRVGACLRVLRFQRGMSIQQLANAAGIPKARLLEFEKGEMRLEAPVMAQMCRILDVRPASFFSWLSEEKSATSVNAARYGATLRPAGVPQKLEGGHGALRQLFNQCSLLNVRRVIVDEI